MRRTCAIHINAGANIAKVCKARKRGRLRTHFRAAATDAEGVKSVQGSVAGTLRNSLLNDLTYKNYYIFTRYKDFADPVVKAYMKYFATRNADSRETETINDQVAYYKADTLIRNKYMTYEYDLHESKEEGRAEGRVEERREMAAAMLAEGDSVEKVVRISKLSEEDVLLIKAKLGK